MVENIIKTDEIIKKMNHPKQSKITPDTRAMIIVGIAEGKTQNKLADELGVSTKTIENEAKNNREMIGYISEKIASKKAKIEEKLIFKGLEVLNQKLDEMAKDEKTRAEVKLTELSGMIKTLFDKTQIEKGEPTSINKTTHEDIQTKRLELMKTARLIEKGTITDLLNETIEGEIVEQ